MTTPATWDLAVSSAVSGAASSVVTQAGVVVAGEIRVGRVATVVLAAVVVVGSVLLGALVVPRLAGLLSRGGTGVIVAVGAIGGGVWVGAVWWSVATSSPVNVGLVVLAGVGFATAGAVAGRRPRPSPASVPSGPGRRPRRLASAAIVVAAAVAVVAAVTLLSTDADRTPIDGERQASVTTTEPPERSSEPSGDAEQGPGAEERTGTTAPAVEGCTEAAAQEAIRNALEGQLGAVVARFHRERRTTVGCPDPEDFGPHRHGTDANRTWELRFTGPNGKTLLVGTPGGDVVFVPEPLRDHVRRQLDTQPIVQVSRIDVEGTTTFLFGLPGGQCTAVYQYEGRDPFTFDPPSVALVAMVLMVTQGQWGEATEAVPGQRYQRQIDVTFKDKVGPDRHVTIGVTDTTIELSGDFKTVRDATACPSGLTLESLGEASPRASHPNEPEDG